MEGSTNQGNKRGSNIFNSLRYNNHTPIINQESSPRRINSSSSRRGSSIFSPTPQTLDHHHHQPYNNNHNPTNLNPPTNNLEYPTSDSDPTAKRNPTAKGAGVIASSSRTPPAQLPQEPATKPPPPPPSAISAEVKSAERPVIRYKECLKNHAANAGGHVLDGCGEFMPGGEEGSPEHLRCAACDCHRNFHRKEIEGEYNCSPHQLILQRPYGAGNANHQRKAAVHHRNHVVRDSPPQGFVAPPTMMNFGGGGKVGGAESSSEDLNNAFASGSKKRFRTKFSQEQKDKMQEFASKLNWTIQRQDDQEVMRFCNDVGVKRQVFKVWMHNNKQAMKRKPSPDHMS